MKLVKKLSVIAIMAIMTTTGLNAAVNEDYNSDYTTSRKLGRSISNIALGIVELPKAMVEEDKRNGSVAAYSTGVLKGVGRFVVREAVGVWELVTFWNSEKEPILAPEYVWDMPVDEGHQLDIDPNDHSDHGLHAE
jgi:putative exosortase-associated protein (TIGR04073 family)